jgi:hypothetical protein
VADTFSKTLAETHLIKREAFAACGGIQDTVQKTRLLIQESRELMAEADQRLKGAPRQS